MICGRAWTIVAWPSCPEIGRHSLPATFPVSHCRTDDGTDEDGPLSLLCG